MFQYLRFRIQRQLRRWRRDFRFLKSATSNYLMLNVWGKWRQLGIIRRLILSWWGIILISLALLGWQWQNLQAYYVRPLPIPGGQYTEALVGNVKNINPIMPEGAATSSASKLVFSGLTRYNSKRQLEGDLATSWDISADNKTYTFHLRHGVLWHDGVPFNSGDVAFTLTAVQNPDTRSPLSSSWQGIKVETPDDYTVVYTLPNAYPPFITFTTVGILPRHIFYATDPAALRTSDFNQKPIGTGPFKIRKYTAGEGEIRFDANPKYFGGRPQLDEIILRLYDNSQAAIDAYAKHRVSGIADIDSSAADQASKLPKLKLRQLALPGQTYLFMKTTSPALADKSVRQGIELAIDRQAIIRAALGGNATPSNSPLLPGQLGYNGRDHQPNLDLKAAVSKLGGKNLKLTLVTRDGGDYPKVAALIKEQLGKAGVMVEVKTVASGTLQQSYIRPRNYDLLLFGLNIGADPDVYVYWHSSQISDPGLNLSQYSSAVADKALEAGRIYADDDIRSGKYATFTHAWVDDTPAVALYSPVYLYGQHFDVMGVSADKLVDPTDRFYGVEKWTARVKSSR